MSDIPKHNPRRNSEDKLFGCFFIAAAVLTLAFFVAILAIIFAGIDLAYENWG